MNIGGIESLIMNLFRSMNKNTEYVFLTYKDNKYDYEDEIIKLGGKIIRIPEPKNKNRIRHIKNLKRVFKEEKPDVVHCHTYYDTASVLYAAKKAGIKRRIAHSHTTEKAHGVRRLLRWLMRKTINENATQRFACSEEAGKALFGKKGSFVIIPNGMDTNKYLYNSSLRDLIRKQMRIGDHFVIGHIGRMVDVKNHEFIIEVARVLKKITPRFKIVFIGDGEKKPAIIDLIKEYNLENNVIMLGNKMNANEYLNAFDCFILPSKYEGLSTALIEAQLNGLPAVISNKIPNEAIMNNNIIKEDLDASAEKWARDILSLPRNRVLPAKSIVDKYSIKNVVRHISTEYGIRREEAAEKVSIIIPMYNASPYIKRCILSVLSQTYRNIEVVIVDDGSNDNSKEIVKEFARNDKRVKVYSQKNKGANIARINGINHATGYYTMFLDADDYILENTVETIVSSMNDSKADSMKFCALVKPSNSVIGESLKNRAIVSKKEKNKELLTTDNYSALWMQAFKTSILKKIDFPNIKVSYCEDYLTSFMIHQKVEKTIVTNDILYVYCKNNESTTNTVDKNKLVKNIKERIIVSSMLIECMHKKYRKSDIYDVAYSQFYKLMRDFCKLIHRSKINTKELEDIFKEIFSMEEYSLMRSAISESEIESRIRRLQIVKRLIYGDFIMSIYKKQEKMGLIKFKLLKWRRI